MSLQVESSTAISLIYGNDTITFVYSHIVIDKDYLSYRYGLDQSHRETSNLMYGGLSRKGTVIYIRTQLQRLSALPTTHKQLGFTQYRYT